MKTPITKQNAEEQKGNWNAIWSLTIGVCGLIIAEFLPAGMLTPMAKDLGVSEGLAGQAVTATSILAVLTSLSIAFLTRKLNRRTVLLSLSFLLALSSLIVAFAPGFKVVLLGRIVLGISLGGFWSMATAISIRLVPASDLPKALSLIFGGSSFASVLAAPLGSFLGNIVGWRSVFLFAAAVGVIAFIWQLAALPSLKPNGTTRLRTAIDVLKTPEFGAALMAIMFVFCGRFASFTYLRPFLEQTTHASPTWVSVVLLVFGLAYFAGNVFAPRMIQRDIRNALLAPPLLLALISIGFLFFGSSLFATIILVFLWGAGFGPIPPAWSTWVAKKVPEHAETGGGLYVAAVQSSAAIGASLGGYAFDLKGSSAVFLMCGLSWVISALLVYRKISAMNKRVEERVAQQTNVMPISVRRRLNRTRKGSWRHANTSAKIFGDHGRGGRGGECLPGNCAHPSSKHCSKGGTRYGNYESRFAAFNERTSGLVYRNRSD
jgi:DHA1 family purine ribonucleoside efflux pump-like MFS transporter